MKKLLSLSIAILFACNLFAQQSPIVIDLWPNGAPNSNGLTGPEEQREGGRLAHVVTPTLTIFPASKSNGMAIIACPGGGYVHLAMRQEGTDMAPWLNNLGITLAVLKYRMPNGHHDVPLSDAQQAIRIIRQRAKEWGIDPGKVGIMGGSAGGHLASTAATHYTTETRPDFQILFYPVIQMNRKMIETLAGKNISEDLINYYSSDHNVTSDTPKAFIMCSADDKVVSCEHSIFYFNALIKAGVSTSLHIYPTGGHGWGYNETFLYKHQWTDELEKWLMELYR